MQACNSVMAEMRLAPRIRELLARKEVLEMFGTMGIEKVQNIDPLIAIIDKNTKKKYVVYDYKNGDYISTKTMDYEKQLELVYKLRVYFEKNGIVVDDMVCADQMMLDMKTKTIYFNDTEMWSRIPKSSETSKSL